LNVKDGGGGGGGGPFEILMGVDGSGGIVSTMTNHDLQLRAGGNNTYVIIKDDGKVGIGTRSPNSALHVAGDVTVDGKVGIGTSSPNSALHVAGDVTVTGDVLLTGADCAEHFDIAGSEVPEPGTVVVINEAGALRECRDAYDKKVAGVVSGAGEYRHALVLDKRPSREQHVALALVGKVYCKVDARYSPIEVGDLLTTSATPGHAMKAAEPVKAFGSVIGKALRPLNGGQGLIPILISLQ
jgi:hypothetical protein